MEHPIENIKKEYPNFFKQLIEAGCLVDINLDEPNLLKQRISEVDETKKKYWMTVNPTVSCNFSCWYCYENHEKTKMQPEVLSAIKKLISKETSSPELEEFNLNFFGGEPLIYYDDVVLPIIQHLNVCKREYSGLQTYIHFTTNGYLLNDKMIESLRENKVNSFQITLDGTREEHDRVRFPYKGGKSFDKIIENVTKLLKSKFQVILRLNYTQDNAARMKEIISAFVPLNEEDKKYLVVDFQQVWQDRDNSTQTAITEERMEECMDLFKKEGIHISHWYHNFVWNSCYGDKKNASVINYNGDVYKCTARDFKTENREGVLLADGTIKWDNEKCLLRQTIRYSRKECQTCRIAPICAGSCSQKQIERRLVNPNDCLLGYDESFKDEIVLDKFYTEIVEPQAKV